MALSAGARLGPYEILGLIGRGGMGEVYRVHDSRLGRDVALKLLPAEYASQPERLSRFEREARALAALDHPNILSVHDVGRFGDSAFFVSELLEGETLEANLAGRRVSVGRAIGCAAQIARGLAAAHDRGVVHRDLKPANVFLTRDGRVKILDFGVAKLKATDSDAATESSPVLTEAGSVIGTAAYMSPEQARGLPLDQRTDLFALGAILYEMLSGRRAFERPTTAETMTAVIREDPVSLSTLGAAVTPAIDRIVRRCLAKDPEARFRTAHDLTFALEGLAEEAEPARTDLPARRSWPWILTAAAAVIVAGVLLWREQTPVPRQDVTRFHITAYPDRPWRPTGFALFALSPDGRSVVYGYPGSGMPLMLQPFDEAQARPLAGTETGLNPFFSPDGQWIGFFAGRELLKVSTAGGGTATICTLPAELRGASWGDNGYIVYAPLGHGLWRVPAAGGEPQQILAPPADEPYSHYMWPYILPGGKAVLFTGVPSGPGAFTLLGLRLSGGEVQEIVQRASDPEYSSGRLFFGRGSSLWAVRFDPETLQMSGEPWSVVQKVGRYDGNGGTQFSVSRAGDLAYLNFVTPTRQQPVFVDEGGRERAIEIAPEPYRLPRVSSDGRLLVMETPTDLVVVDLQRGGVTRLRPAGALQNPVWTRDGTRLVYSGGEGTPNLWSIRPDGSGEPERVSNTDGPWHYSFDVSPSGEVLYAVDYPQTRLDLWVKPASGPPRLLESMPGWDTAARISPDGRWVAYNTITSTGRHVWVKPLDGTASRVKVSTNSGSEPVWSRTSNLLYFRRGREMLRVRYGTGSTFVPGSPERLFTADYAEDGPFGAMYDVMPDGRFIMLKPLEQPDEPAVIDVVLNWIQELKSSAPR